MQRIDITKICKSCGSEFIVPSGLKWKMNCSTDCRKSINAFLLHVHKTASCWLWLASTDKDGYGWSSYFGQKKAHRCSYVYYKGPIPSGLMVRHKCDTPACVNPDHLILGTVIDNNKDCTSRERQARGETSGKTTLTPEFIKQIRLSYREGVFTNVIASTFGITNVAVTSIATGRTWSSIHQELICSKRGRSWKIPREIRLERIRFKLAVSNYLPDSAEMN